MTTTQRYILFWLTSWAILVVVFIQSRTLLPIDETRYTGVAWEMWSRQNFLVPHLNGNPYSHKPPLFFWLIHLGWWIFGVNDWWPRMIPSLFGLGTLFLTCRFSRQLWPGNPDIAILAPTLLIGCALWLQFLSSAMFDMILAFWVLLTVYSIYMTATTSGRRLPYWFLTGMATGLGLLTKGPVMLLHVLPVALLGPVWIQQKMIRWRHWYSGVLGMVLVASAVILSWAIPAAIYGGDTYARAIFWGQTANRMVDSVAHQKPWWFYFPILPMILFPWFVWPAFWKSLVKTGLSADYSLRFCLAWLLPVFLSFVLISGKQPHYLLPLFPAFCLISAYALSNTRLQTTGKSQLLHTALYLLAGILFLSAPYLQTRYDWPDWVTRIDPYFGIILLMLAVLVLIPWRPADTRRRVTTLAIVAMVTSLTLNLFFSSNLLPQFDLRQVSQYIQAAQLNNIPIAHMGKYHEQFHFYGRLEKGIDMVDHDTVRDWIQKNPDGRIITYPRSRKLQGSVIPLYQQKYRGRWVVIWSASQILNTPDLVHY